MVNKKRNSVKDNQVQGNRLVGPDDGVSDSSPKKKRSRRLPGRSKSLADATGSNSRPVDASRNTARYTQPYLRRAPTQDDIYKIFTETSDSIRPSTGKLKRLSPYVPLPAIGTKIRPLKDSDTKVKETADSSSVTSFDDGNQKLVREGTYNVLEPKFVKGPTVSDVSGNVAYSSEENNSDEGSNKAVDQLKASSATIMFGPRLPKREENVIEEDLTVTDVPGEQRHKNLPTTHSNTSIKTKTSIAGNKIKSILMQKLYHRDAKKNGSQELDSALTSIDTE